MAHAQICHKDAPKSQQTAIKDASLVSSVMSYKVASVINSIQDVSFTTKQQDNVVNAVKISVFPMVSVTNCHQTVWQSIVNVNASNAHKALYFSQESVTDRSKTA